MEGANDLKTLIGGDLVKVNGDSIESVKFDKFYSDFSAKGEYICFYFGAHWAPPSRIFTSTLNDSFYEVVNESGKIAEVIFVSDDRAENHFERNFKKMPWYGIPYNNKQVIQTLKSRFSVHDLPTLVVVDPKTLKIVDHEGRDHIQGCEKAIEAWKNKATQAAEDGD